MHAHCELRSIDISHFVFLELLFLHLTVSNLLSKKFLKFLAFV